MENWNAHVVDEKLFLGGVNAVGKFEALRAHGITHVLSIVEEGIYVRRDTGKYVYVTISVDDARDTNLLQYFPITNKFIDEGRNAGGVLVHCVAGISRSATIVTAYLMYKKQLSYKDAFAIVKQRRGIISPNLGFHAQLELYEKMKYEVDRTHEVYRKEWMEKDDDASHQRVVRHEHVAILSWKNIFGLGKKV